MRNERDAADRLPPSTAAISVAMASSRSIDAPEKWKEGFSTYRMMREGGSAYLLATGRTGP
jgi:hypothetical protein